MGEGRRREREGGRERREKESEGGKEEGERGCSAWG